MGVLQISVEVPNLRLQAYSFLSRTLGHHEGRAPVWFVSPMWLPRGGKPSKGPVE